MFYERPIGSLLKIDCCALALQERITFMFAQQLCSHLYQLQCIYNVEMRTRL